MKSKFYFTVPREKDPESGMYKAYLYRIKWKLLLWKGKELISTYYGSDRNALINRMYGIIENMINI